MARSITRIDPSLSSALQPMLFRVANLQIGVVQPGDQVVVSFEVWEVFTNTDAVKSGLILNQPKNGKLSAVFEDTGSVGSPVWPALLYSLNPFTTPGVVEIQFADGSGASASGQFRMPGFAPTLRGKGGQWLPPLLDNLV